jgi:DNA mismatch repair protein MutS
MSENEMKKNESAAAEAKEPSKEDYSPMMQHYLSASRKSIRTPWSFYRIGDFYEMFFDDAKTASSRELDLVLTGKNAGVKGPGADVRRTASRGLQLYSAAGFSGAIRSQLSEQTAGSQGSCRSGCSAMSSG